VGNNERKCGDNSGGVQLQVQNDDENDGPAPVRVPIFPKLTSLTLDSLDFNDVVPGSGVLFDLIVNALWRRKVNNTPLTTLSIDDCVISEKQANALNKLVGDFQWDREGRYHKDEGEGDHSDPSPEFDDYRDDHSDISDPGVGQEEAHVSLMQAE
jgi:hypothetical protein